VTIGGYVTDVNDPAKADADTANSQLNEGLKNCRAVVKNYRALLSPELKPLSAAEEDGAGKQQPPPADG
jgi:hypothetical protein